ncbi:MAG TPA: nucleotidyl transferase AbiEii/AbiGii toxin family protein [Planctomycetota bacterium]|nr:nucleotidyl transferase AbiEii/AbiGii toxin family protein [Planctomycetota bacterium]
MPGKLHPEVLARRQALALRELGPILTERGFYLAGGAALALRLAHRSSVDLDWFSETSTADVAGVLAALAAQGLKIDVTSQTETIARAAVHGVKIDLVSYIYPPLEEPVFERHLGCRLASLADIAAMKLGAVAQRGRRRDFVDVVALVRAGIPLDSMLRFYRERFRVRDVGQVLRGLVFFDDAEKERPPRGLAPGLDWKTVKTFLRGAVEKLAR